MARPSRDTGAGVSSSGSGSGSGSTSSSIISSPFLNLKTIDSLLAVSASSPDDIQNRIRLLSAKVHLLVNNLNITFPPRSTSTSTSRLRLRSTSASASPSTSTSNGNGNGDGGGRGIHRDASREEEKATTYARIQVEKDKAVFEICEVRLELAKAYMTPTATISATTSSKSVINPSTRSIAAPSHADPRPLAPGHVHAPDYTSAEVELSLAEKDCRFIRKRNDTRASRSTTDTNAETNTNSSDVNFMVKDETQMSRCWSSTQPIGQDISAQRQLHEGAGKAHRNVYNEAGLAQIDNGSGSGTVSKNGDDTETEKWVEDVRRLQLEILHHLVKVEEGLGRPGRAERWNQAIARAARSR
ncbi:hypothetical protein I316_01099 [Kwoniella heveanensis BCC8398]|uniref:Uncharacterized protein n=1 Tax=Kwoniella heveanensis BCC8398 TaxID=1296120 RepID=A0A1B9H1P2_9TREE|nr:hypothetical protein I316_01099 [Kwoniella heveanensis BCC8398]